MRLLQKKSKKNLIITLSIVGMLVIISIIAYLFMSPKADQQESNSSSTRSQSNNKSDNSSTDNSISTDSNTTVEHEAEKDIQPPYEGENPNSSPSLTGVINYKSVTDGTLIIRTTINQMLSSGTCNLTMTNGAKTITKSSGITQNPSSSSCEGFDIPTSELGSGDWKIDITITNGDRTGNITDSVSL